MENDVAQLYVERLNDARKAEEEHDALVRALDKAVEASKNWFVHEGDVVVTLRPRIRIIPDNSPRAPTRLAVPIPTREQIVDALNARSATRKALAEAATAMTDAGLSDLIQETRRS